MWQHVENNATVYRNKRIHYDYRIEDSFLAGILLERKDIQRIRSHQGFDLSSALVRVENGEAWVHSDLYDEPRKIKLLLNRKEINRLEKHTRDGMRVLVEHAYFDFRGWLKLRLLVGKAMKKHDKREAIKEKDLRKDNND
jgi:SsrA-binding protein